MEIRETLDKVRVWISTTQVSSTAVVSIDSRTDWLDINTRWNDCLILFSNWAGTVCTTSNWSKNITWLHHIPLVAWRYTKYSICNLDGTTPSASVIESY